MTPDEELRARLFGDFADSPDEELNAAFDAVCPDEDARQMVGAICLAAEHMHRARGKVPPHVTACRRNVLKGLLPQPASVVTGGIAEKMLARASDSPCSPASQTDLVAESGELASSAITPATISVATRVAESLIGRYHLASKTDVAYVCSRLHLRIGEMDFSGFDGMLAFPPASRSGFIGVSSAIRTVARKRFTIAHEIGHYLIPGHRSALTACQHDTVECFSTSISKREREANEFALELLLPPERIQQNFDLHRPSLEAISKVAIAQETSLIAAASRFLSLTPESCAMVISRGGHAVWSQARASLSGLLSLRNAPVAGSMAGRLFAGRDIPKGMTPVDPRMWLANQTNLPFMLEESVLLKEDNAVLSFLWAPSPAAVMPTAETSNHVVAKGIL